MELWASMKRCVVASNQFQSLKLQKIEIISEGYYLGS